LVPETLAGWTFETVQTLCVAGQPESDRHDFKFNLAELKNPTKICCAFANSLGGFIVVGVKDKNKIFEIIGLEPDKELYGKFLSKIKADPNIDIPQPKTIGVSGSNKLLYIFHVLQSTRRPHLPSVPDQRVFWKRQGSDCVQMTLEEIRYQMNTYEEKREKLALLLIDLHNKVRSLTEQANIQDNHYNGDVFSFEIIDRVLVEAFSIIKADPTSIGALDTLKRQLMLLNGEKQKLLSMLGQSYSIEAKNSMVNAYRTVVRDTLPSVALFAEQIERSINEKFGIENPYKAKG
jgi:hypothetical protein